MEFRLPDEPVGGILTALACGTAALWRHNHYSAALGGMAAQFGGTGGTIWRHGGAAGGTGGTLAAQRALPVPLNTRCVRCAA